MKKSKEISKGKKKEEVVADTFENKEVASDKEVVKSAKMDIPEKLGKLSKKDALKTSTLAKFLPNAVTITAMCFGLSSIRLAQINEWEYAVLCILVSALLDMFDGKIARFLDQSSAFGLQLDSLSDLVCFGVAPSVVLYLASMQQVGKVGWGICMFYTICCALRLARFNVSHADSERVTELDCKYFVGIPAPAGAVVALFPLIFFFETESFIIMRPFYVACFLMLSGCLMVSTVRTFSSKIIEISNTSSWIALTIIAFVIICLTTRLWMSLSILVAFYILMIPYGIYEYSKALEAKKAQVRESKKVSAK